MTMHETTPQEREERILTGLMKAYFIDRNEARAMLAEHTASELRTIDQGLDTLDNPYVRHRAHIKWAEGFEAVRMRMYMREMRLLALVEHLRKGRARIAEG